MTKEFFVGRHRSYIHPVRIFLVATAIFIYIFSQYIAKKDDTHFMESSEFKIRLYKNYLLNQIDSLKLKQDSLKAGNADPAYSVIVHKIANLKNEVNLKFDAKAIDTPAEDLDESDSDEKVLPPAEQIKKRSKFEPEDSFFYLKIEDKVLKFRREEFEQTTVAAFLKSHPIPIDTSPVVLLASMRRIKARGDYTDTIDLLKYINPDYALSYITDWSDPLEISISFVGGKTYAVALEDLRNLTVDQIVEKFMIESIIDRMVLKQIIKFNLDPKSFVGFLVGTILWILLFFVPIMAVVLKLFYLRQKRYYIEHVVYLLHYHTILLLVFSMMMELADVSFSQPIEIALLVYATVILPFLGLKYYYEQKWLKTLVKGALLGWIYLVMILVFIFSGLSIGFLFY